MPEKYFIVGQDFSIDLLNGLPRMVMPLVGWIHDTILIVRYAGSMDHAKNFYNGSNCVIRFIHDGTAFGFPSSVISLQFSPEPIIFFQYPQKIEHKSFRNAKRYRTKIPIRLIDDQMKGYDDVIITDISETGCLVTLDEKAAGELPANTSSFTIEISLDLSMSILCTVKNSFKRGDARMFGAEFKSLYEKEQDKLRKFLHLLSFEE